MVQRDRKRTEWLKSPFQELETLPSSDITNVPLGRRKEGLEQWYPGSHRRGLGAYFLLFVREVLLVSSVQGIGGDRVSAI